MMKKYLMTLAAVLCCAMMTTVFTACGGDDDDNDKKTDNKPTGVELSVSFSESEDMLEYCDIQIEYNDGTGAKTEAMTTTSWSKTLTAKLPATFTVKKTVTLKADKDMTSAKTIEYVQKYSCNYSLVYASGGASSQFAVTGSSHSGLGAADEMAEVVAKGLLDKTLIFTFDADGNLK